MGYLCCMDARESLAHFGKMGPRLLACVADPHLGEGGAFWETGERKGELNVGLPATPCYLDDSRPLTAENCDWSKCQ